MRRQSTQQPPDVNLAPIMNMVVILIPMLLLSVVFMSVGVINVSSQSGSLVGEPTIEEEPPLNLEIEIRADGFEMKTRDGRIPAISKCPSDGPTICLEKQGDTLAGFEKAAKLDAEERSSEANRKYDETMAAYDWNALYERLKEIKAAHEQETTVRITADAKMPYTMVVRTMDLARFELDGESFASNSEMWKAGKKRPLFPDPVLMH